MGTVRGVSVICSQRRGREGRRGSGSTPPRSLRGALGPRHSTEDTVEALGLSRPRRSKAVLPQKQHSFVCRCLCVCGAGISQRPRPTTREMLERRGGVLCEERAVPLVAHHVSTSLAVGGVARSRRPLDGDADAAEAEAPSRTHEKQAGTASAQLLPYGRGQGTLTQDLRTIPAGKANALSRTISALAQDAKVLDVEEETRLPRTDRGEQQAAAQPPVARLIGPTAWPRAAVKAAESSSILRGVVGLSCAAKIPIALDIKKVTRNAANYTVSPRAIWRCL